MIIKFVVDVDDGNTYSVPIACESSWTVLRAITALRLRISLPAQANVSVRCQTGSPIPVDTNVLQLNSSMATSSSPSSVLVLHAIVDIASNLVPSLRLPRALGQRATTATDSDDTDTERPCINSDSDDPQRVTNEGTVSGKSSVTCLGPSSSEAQSCDPEDDADVDDNFEADLLVDDLYSSAGDSERTSPASIVSCIHTIVVNRSFRKSYATRTFAMGEIVVREQPLLTIAYPQQLVEAVRSNTKLQLLSFDPRQRAPTTIPGVSNEEYAKYLSIALTHGLSVHTGGRFEHQIAFFPDITSCRHSCFPNVHFARSQERPPYEGVLRCATRSGINTGDEVTYLYPKTDTREFVSLPRDRRERLMRRFFYLKDDEYCSCSRCWKADRDERELAITGAFFDEAATEASRNEAAAAMRATFERLHLVNENSKGSFLLSLVDVVPIVTAAGRPTSELAAAKTVHTFSRMCDYARELQRFVTLHTRRTPTAPSSRQRHPLALHPLHWRLSLARLRMMEVFQWLIENRPAARRAAETVSRACAQQDAPTGTPAAAATVDALQIQSPQLTTTVGGTGSTGTLPPIPFCRAAFDATLDQLQAEAVVLPVGHPLSLPTFRIWKRMLSQIPAKQAATVQQLALSSLYCPDVHWETLQALERFFIAKAPSGNGTTTTR